MVTPLDETNPLLKPPTLPYDAPPLAEVKVAHFVPALEKAIEEAKAEIDVIKFKNTPPTFENTVEALEFAGQKMGRVAGIFSNLSSAASSDDMRAMEADFETACVKHGNDVMMDDMLFDRVKAVYDARAILTLTDEQKMLLENTYKRFVRSGALLDVSQKQKLRDINERLAKLGVDYANNTVKATKEYKKVISDEKELAGLPERAKNNYRQCAEDVGMSGKWMIPLSPPPADVLEYAENRALRQEIRQAMSSIAYGGAYDNRDITLEIVRLRHERAQLLGYPTHAAFVLDERMAKTPKEVIDFLEKNGKTYRPEAEKFVQQIKDYAQKTDGITNFKPWDLAYYWRKLQEETFKLDTEELRPYFDLEKVLDGARIHAQKLFGIEMTEVKGKYPVYHPDVKVYEVRDQKTGEMIGLFYADYYARAGAKQAGAWMNTFRNRGMENGENKFPFVANTCNFDKPTKDQPTLLSVDEVRTVFHEFGHGLHALLAQGRYQSMTGTNVKWDFVELPSQLMENWVEQKEVLDSFAAHYKTAKKLPDALIQKIKDMSNFGAGYSGLRQTLLGMLDMAWHNTDPANIKSLEALEDSVVAKYALFPREPDGSISTSFKHIFSGGYSAGYYSYKWAEVLEADVFEVFKRKGLYDAASGQKLRDTIYSKGGTVDPAVLFRQMMGRDPDPNALFRREGLTPPDNDNKQPDCTKPPKSL